MYSGEARVTPAHLASTRNCAIAAVLAGQAQAVLAPVAGEAEGAAALREAGPGGVAGAAVGAATVAQVQRDLAPVAGPLRQAIAAQRSEGVQGLGADEVHVAHALVLAELRASVVLASGARVLRIAEAFRALTRHYFAFAAVAVQRAGRNSVRYGLAGLEENYKTLMTNRCIVKILRFLNIVQLNSLPSCS